MNEGLMTGIFWTSEVRETIRQRYSAGRTVHLQLARVPFSVCCSDGRLVRATSVDVANRSLEKTKSSCSQQDWPRNPTNHNVMDVCSIISNTLWRNSWSLILVVVGPPSFARTKRELSLWQDYSKLLPKSPLSNKRNARVIDEQRMWANPNSNKWLRKRNSLTEDNHEVRIVLKGLPSDFASSVTTPLVIISKYSLLNLTSIPAQNSLIEWISGSTTASQTPAEMRPYAISTFGRVRAPTSFSLWHHPIAPLFLAVHFFAKKSHFLQAEKNVAVL